MKYFKKLEGRHIYLSPMSSEDAEKYVEWLNDLEVTHYLNMARRTVSVEKEKEFLQRMVKEENIFAIIRKDKDRLIGNCGLHNVDGINRTAELGIFIGDKSCWGKGYGEEAVKLLLDHGFNILNLKNIMLRVFSFNERARRCYEKCGFKTIGSRRKAIVYGSKEYDILFMDILSTEFTGSVLDPLLG
jgi:RimJ/RimL family protein N-acetyltransferase